MKREKLQNEKKKREAEAGSSVVVGVDVECTQAISPHYAIIQGVTTSCYSSGGEIRLTQFFPDSTTSISMFVIYVAEFFII
jgi:hypothetical protein